MLARGSQPSLAVAPTVIAALVLLAWTRDTCIELLGETLFASMALLFAFTFVGAWRQ